MNTKNNILDDLIRYLSGKKTTAAIVDEDFNLVWSGDDGFWTNAVHRISRPVETDRVFSIVFNGERCPVTAVEYCVGNDVYYVLELYNAGITAQLVKKSSFAKKLKSSADSAAIGIRNIIGLCEGLSCNLAGGRRKEQRKTIEAQFLCAFDLLAQNINISTFMDDAFAEENERADVKPIFDSIYKVCVTKLSQFGREISYVSDTSTGQVGLSERKISVMILNLVQNAFLYSPRETPVTMHLNFTRNKARIKIINQKSKDGQVYASHTAGIGRELAKSIAESCGGTCVFGESARKVHVEIELPIINTVSEIEMSSRFASLSNDKFSPAGLYLNKVIKYEMGLED